MPGNHEVMVGAETDDAVGASGLFAPLTLGPVTIPNRIMLSPMSQHAADPGGCATAWHLVHYGSRAVGGVGLIMLEDTAVTASGRAGPRSLGLYTDEQMRALVPTVDFCHAEGAAVGIQLGHTGRKAFATTAEVPFDIVGATGEPFEPDGHRPRRLDAAELCEIVTAFASAAERAARIGIDVIEIHASHGYLLHEFLSPLTNHRDDDFGGSAESRARLLRAVTAAVRGAVGDRAAIFVRLAVDDLVEGGLGPEDCTDLIAGLTRLGVDAIDVGAGGAVPASLERIPMIDPAALSALVRTATGARTVVSGGVGDRPSAERILQDESGDLLALGRLLLANPYWPLQQRSAF